MTKPSRLEDLGRDYLLRVTTPVVVHCFPAAHPLQHVRGDCWVVDIASHGGPSQVLEKGHGESVAHGVYIDGGHEGEEGFGGQHQTPKALTQHSKVGVSFCLNP